MVAPLQQRMQSPVSVPRLLPGQLDQRFPQVHVPSRPYDTYNTEHAGFGPSTVTEPVSAVGQGSPMNSLRSALTGG
ncbi:MAG: hypothetical protein M3N41_02965 [Acidobacteriota bacterium]|nr:hypothetical protein [Acidobacteriota bacterium]